MAKKNYRKIPQSLTLKIRDFGERDFVIACVRRISLERLQRGDFVHLGLSFGDGQPVFEPSVLPPARRGRFSRANLNGRVIVRRDLPKVLKSFSFEVPNFGDWSKGSHTVTQTREVYQRDFIPPFESEIKIDLLRSPDSNRTEYVFKFAVDEVLNSAQPDCDERIFANINLLQENVGSIDAFSSDATLQEYLATMQVDWELLPVGTREGIVMRLLTGVRRNREQIARTIEERRNLLAKLNPIGWVIGSSGFRRYFGAQFRDDLVVFENIDYGNAAYVMFGNWATLSRLSRTELLRSENNFIRILHRSGWEKKLSEVIRENLGSGPGERLVA
jgi:hypothetical protein